MKVWLKRVLFGLVVVIIVALIGLAIFLLTFDPNAYKSKLEEIVYSRYHRTLAIKGDIELSLFPRIGLSVQGLSLSDRDSTNTFASIDSARFAVAIWPLMSNRLVVDHVAVSGFKAWIVRDRPGHFNFQDLMGGASANDAASQTPSGPPEPKPAALSVLTGHEAARADFQIDIAGLNLKNGEVHLRDFKTGARTRIENLTLNTGRVTFDQPFDVDFKGNVVGVYPKAAASLDGQAVVRINPEQKVYSAQKLNVHMSGALDALDAKTVSLRGNLAYSAYSQLFTASNLELVVQGDVQGARPVKNLSINLSVPQLKVDRSQSELLLEKLSLRSKGALPTQDFELAVDAPNLSISPDAAKGDAVSGTLKLTGPQKVLGLAVGVSGLGGNANDLTLKELKMEGGLKQGLRVVQFKVSSPANWSAYKQQGGLSAIKGDVKIEDPSLPGDSFEFPLIGSMQADLVKDQVSSEINAVLNGSKLDLKLKATRLNDPQIVFDLNADTLDFDKLLPPEHPKVAAAAAADAKAATTGGKPAAPSAPAKPAAPVDASKPSSSVNLSPLEALDLSGTVKVAHINARGLQLGQFNAGVRVLNGKLDVAPLSADLYQGALSGTLSADAHNAMSAQLSLAHVNVDGLLTGLTGQSRLSGTGDIALNLHAQGATVAALKADVSGTVQAHVHDGAVKGINVAQTLREVGGAVENAFSGQMPDVVTKFDASRQTDFSTLDAQLAFERGQGTFKKLDLNSPMLRVTEGSPNSIDLVNKQLDLLVNVRLVNTLMGQGGPALASLKGVTVPILVAGPFAALGYHVQWKDIGSKAVKQAVRDGLLDLMSNQVGKDFMPKADKLGVPVQPAAPTKSDTIRSIGNALKGLLGK
jgi:AsmA protein